jgi:hypothetical protein
MIVLGIHGGVLAQVLINNFILDREVNTMSDNKGKTRKAVGRALNKAIGRKKFNEGGYNKSKKRAVVDSVLTGARYISPAAVDAVELSLKGTAALGLGTIAGAKLAGTKAVRGAKFVGDQAAAGYNAAKDASKKAGKYLKKNEPEISKTVGRVVLGSAATVLTGGAAPAVLGAAMLYKRREKIGKGLVRASGITKSDKGTDKGEYHKKIKGKFQDRLQQAKNENSKIVAASHALTAGKHYAAQKVTGGLSRVARNVGQTLIHSKTGNERGDSLTKRASKTLIPKEIRHAAKEVKSTMKKFTPYGSKDS